MASIRLENITKSYGNNEPVLHDISMDITDGEFLVIVGPSGCGKSTLLRMIAGLEEITSGTLFFNEKVMNSVPPKDRDVGMVFQNYALYPHLTVAENIGFPLRLRKAPAHEITQRVNDVAAMLQLASYLQRKPKELSGGQRQRVALGRAIARYPQCFLFDEPLSNLDAQLRTQMRTEILALQKKVGVTGVYVTHDQTEAMTMGDRIAILHKGKLQQLGTPKEVYQRPSNIFVAQFIGTPIINILEGGCNGAFFETPTVRLSLPVTLLTNTHKMKYIGFRPDDVVIHDEGRFNAEVVHSEFIGHETTLHLCIQEDQIRARMNGNSSYTIGETIRFDIVEKNVLFFDDEKNTLHYH